MRQILQIVAYITGAMDVQFVNMSFRISNCVDIYEDGL
jgi:hypothetical protein